MGTDFWPTSFLVLRPAGSSTASVRRCCSSGRNERSTENVMIRPLSLSLLPFSSAVFLALSLTVAAQEQADEPVANPGRPTVSTPATLTPVGYFQFESGFEAAGHSPEFSSRYSFTEVV